MSIPVTQERPHPDDPDYAIKERAYWEAKVERELGRPAWLFDGYDGRPDITPVEPKK